MTLNRSVFSGGVLAYLAVASGLGSVSASEILVEVYPVFIIYFALSLALFAHIVAHPAVSPRRRVVAIVHDLAMISFTAQACGEGSGFFYPLFLWTIFGNGFRFGLPYLYAATGVALVGFTVVLARTGFWVNDLGLSIALLLGLLMLPMYVAKLIKKLSLAKQQAEEASRAKSLFLASVSHELRTPLNAIIGLSALLRDQGLDRDKAEMVDTIGGAGRTLLGLINSILDLSRLEAGKMPATESEFRVHDTVRHVVSVMTTQARAKGLRLGQHVSVRTPDRVRGVHRHLEEVLFNLVGNAIKFTEQGHVVVSVDCVETEPGSWRILCEVADSGIGIAPTAQSRIFEAFTQADDTIIDRFGGTGLGLALCKQLIESQGGRIGLESAPGRGSRFWFELPVQPRSDTLPEEAPRQPVLVVSGDPSLVEAVAAAGAPASAVALVADLRDHLVDMGADAATILVDGTPLDEGTEAALAALAVDYAGRLSFVAVQPDGITAPLPLSQRALFVTALQRPLAADTIAAALAIGEGRVRSAEVAVGLGGRAARPLAVLVAEDNRTNQMVLTKILERAGHRPVCVDDGQEALEALRQAEFDIVLMDVNMPRLNGIEAAKLYRLGSIGRRRVPIVALTADATEETRARCEEAGMDACATKPIEPRMLLDLIQRVTGASGATSSGPMFADPDPHRSRPVAIAARTLDELETLGGRAFVQELLDQFFRDADQVCSDLGAAVEARDHLGFRYLLHALRSGAANVGAEGPFGFCLEHREITREALVTNGLALVEELRGNLAAAEAALQELGFAIGRADAPMGEPGAGAGSVAA